jgi:hypothetical protein
MVLAPDDPVYVDLDAMTVLLLNGDSIAITTLFDVFGDMCDDPDEAVVVVAGSDEGGWWTIPLPWASEEESIH